MNSVPTLRKAHCAFVTRLDWLLLIRGKVNVYSENHTKHTYTLWVLLFINVKALIYVKVKLSL
jgi:hypothetical protein